MQIHELNQPRKSQVNEINWGSMFSSAQLGAAQQAATQAAAAKNAEKLANPNWIRRALGNPAYTVGGSVADPVTLPQSLQTVMQNPAVQQMVNNLKAQWQAQAPTVVNAARRRATDTAPAAPAASSSAPAASAGAADTSAVDTQLQDVESAFQRWSDSKLAISRINMDSIRSNPAYKQALSDQLTKVAVQSLADPKSPATTQAINTYFNTAIAAIQAEVKNKGTATAPASTTAQSASAAGSATPTDAEILTLVQQQGVSLTKAELEKLGQIMTSATGSNVVGNTGNPVLNALARLAGMRVT
jgi:hypothetical protein